MSFELHRFDRSPMTQADYERAYRLHIAPYFENERLDQIKPSDLARWQNKLLEKLGSRRVGNVRIVFNTFFVDAMKDDLIQRNPFSLVKAPRRTESREKMPFSVDEIYKILDYMPDRMKAFFTIGFFTGMRTGEIIALKWEDVDFKDRVIRVRRRIRMGVEGPPKTKNSIRDVDIIDALMPYLQNHRALMPEDVIYLFESNLGKPYTTADKISAWYWKPALKELGIAYRNLYQMRHTFASMMIANGEDILWVSKMLGHKDSSMTLQKYARYIKQEGKRRGAFLISA